MSPSFDINDGPDNIKTAVIEYDGPTDSISVSVSDEEGNTATLTNSNSIKLDQIVGNSAFVGFSGGTGPEEWDENRIRSINFQTQQVPFEAEGTMGLVALGGYLFYRYRKKRNQALSQESNG